MSLALAFGRLSSRAEGPLCLRLSYKTWTNSFRSSRTSIRTFLARTRPPSQPKPWRTYHARPTVLMSAGSGALVAATFVGLSEKGSAAPDDTAQGLMLEVSREEIKKTVSESEGESDGILTHLGRHVVLFLDLYVWEPICTGFRFLQLAAIFVPVLLTVPVIWVGSRQPDRDNERTGTLWWYGFLVQSMEWAGPAFIKVMWSSVAGRHFNADWR